MSLAETIIREREARGLKQAQLARKLRVHRSYICRIEHGDVPRLPMLKKLARFFDLNVAFDGRDFQLERKAS